MNTVLRTIAIMMALFTIGLLTDSIFNSGMITQEAHAIVGRPLTPGSYAGVARRTTRRTIRRTTAYVAALPKGCTTVVIEGATLHQCGGTYYQPSGNKYVVVVVN